MGWAIGYDTNWQRWIGYGVSAHCDHPGCTNVIDRGLSYVCCDKQPYGGEDGCGLYFCPDHQDEDGKCYRCRSGMEPFEPKPEHPTWLHHILTDDTWADWRGENSQMVSEIKKQLNKGEGE